VIAHRPKRAVSVFPGITKRHAALMALVFFSARAQSPGVKDSPVLVRDRLLRDFRLFEKKLLND